MAWATIRECYLANYQGITHVYTRFVSFAMHTLTVPDGIPAGEKAKAFVLPIAINTTP